MIDYHVYSPSYKRSNLCTSHLLFKKDKFTYCIGENEIDDYNHDVNYLKIPPEKNINIATARNYILEQAQPDNFIMVDDDIKDIAWTYRRQRKKLSIIDLDYIINEMFYMCGDIGLGLWGMNQTSDPLVYKIDKPFRFDRPVLGPFLGIIKNEIRFDEKIYLKEDYDYFLQNLKKYNACLRADFLSYNCDHQTLAGGCVNYRTNEIEFEHISNFQKKWGSKVVKKNQVNKNSINPTIRV